MKVAVGSDEHTPLVDVITDALAELGHEPIVLADGDPWPDVGHRIGEAVTNGEAERGVVCCWTGTGVSIAANKVPGIRAALCTDADTARGARKWNDANVLAMGLRLTSPELAKEMVAAFLSTDPEPDEAANIKRVEVAN